MKTASIEATKYRTSDFLFGTSFNWVGSKYLPIRVTHRLIIPLKERVPEWKLKVLDYSMLDDSYLLIRGDVGLGIYWVPIKFSYWFYNKIYWGFKSTILRFCLSKLKIGYQKEGTILQWRSLIRRKSK